MAYIMSGKLVLGKNTKLAMDFCPHLAIACSNMIVFYFDNSLISFCTFSGRTDNPLFLQTTPYPIDVKI